MTPTKSREWYYADKNALRIGPVDEEKLLSLWREGAIAPDTLVWREGFAGWVKIASALVPPAPAASPAPLPRGLRGWLVVDGLALCLLGILSSAFLLGIPLVFAGTALLLASPALPKDGADGAWLPFLRHLRLAAAASGILAVFLLLACLLAIWAGLFALGDFFRPL